MEDLIVTQLAFIDEMPAITRREILARWEINATTLHRRMLRAGIITYRNLNQYFYIKSEVEKMMSGYAEQS